MAVDSEDFEILFLEWLKKNITKVARKYRVSIESIDLNENSEFVFRFTDGKEVTAPLPNSLLDNTGAPELRVRNKKLEYFYKNQWICLIDLAKLFKEVAPTLSTGTSPQNQQRLFVRVNDSDLVANTKVINFTGGVTGTKTGTSTARINVEGFQWKVISSDTTLEKYTGYITNSSSDLVLTLPISAEPGDSFKLLLKGDELDTIAQNPGQQILYGNKETTPGTSGFIEARQKNSALTITCVEQDNLFMVESSIGNFRLG